jgi:hypothetical protein
MTRPTSKGRRAPRLDAGGGDPLGASLANLARDLLYGPDHALGVRVPPGGSSCASCRWVRPEGEGPHCDNRLWQLWPRNRGGGGGNRRLPVKDATTFCCDLWRASQATAAAPAPRRTEGLLKRLFEGAEAHGEASGPDQETGDLQDLLRASWERLSPEQRRAVYAEHEAVAQWRTGR